MTGATKSPRRTAASGETAGRKDAPTTAKGRAGTEPEAVHEAAHAVVAVLLGFHASASLGRRGHGATDIRAGDDPASTERLLVALVAGGEAEGRLLHVARRAETAHADAKEIARIVGPLGPGAALRIAAARTYAARMVRDERVWRAIEEVAAELAGSGRAGHERIRSAVGNAGLEPATFSL